LQFFLSLLCAGQDHSEDHFVPVNGAALLKILAISFAEPFRHPCREVEVLLDQPKVDGQNSIAHNAHAGSISVNSTASSKENAESIPLISCEDPICLAIHDHEAILSLVQEKPVLSESVSKLSLGHIASHRKSAVNHPSRLGLLT
jgi:hypothetical protein